MDIEYAGGIKEADNIDLPSPDGGSWKDWQPGRRWIARGDWERAVPNVIPCISLKSQESTVVSSPLRPFHDEQYWGRGKVDDAGDDAGCEYIGILDAEGE